MKKILSALVLMSFLTVLLVPMVASAQAAPKECCTLKRAITLDTAACVAGSVAAPTVAAAVDCAGDHCTASADKWGMFCLMNTLYNVTDWIFVVLIALAGIFVILGAFTYLTSAGDPEKTKSGRNYIMYAFIGLVIAFLARAIPAIAKLVAGV